MKVNMHDTIRDYKRRQYNRSGWIIRSLLFFALGLLLTFAKALSMAMNVLGVWIMIISVIVIIIAIFANKSDKREFKYK